MSSYLKYRKRHPYIRANWLIFTSQIIRLVKNDHELLSTEHVGQKLKMFRGLN